MNKLGTQQRENRANLLALKSADMLCDVLHEHIWIAKLSMQQRIDQQPDPQPEGAESVA